MKKISVFCLLLALAVPMVFAQKGVSEKEVSSLPVELSKEQLEKLRPMFTAVLFANSLPNQGLKKGSTVGMIKMPQMTGEELAACRDAVQDWKSILAEIGQMEKENKDNVLQMFANFYQRFAEKFAKNENISETFEAKNPKVVNFMKRYLKAPFKAGWQEENIRAGGYIFDYMESCDKDSLNEEELKMFNLLKVFNQEILLTPIYSD